VRILGSRSRGLVLICATTLEELLKRCIEAHLVEHRDVKNLTNGFNAPIAGFANRILFAFAVGLISKQEYDDLTRLRKIRNEFAHSIDASFQSPNVVSHCESIKGVRTAHQDDSPRGKFVLNAIFMVAVLEGRITEASEQRLFHREWKSNSEDAPSS
jgi:hypothetical protein